MHYIIFQQLKQDLVCDASDCTITLPKHLTRRELYQVSSLVPAFTAYTWRGDKVRVADDVLQQQIPTPQICPPPLR